VPQPQGTTPSQTVGPFFQLGLEALAVADVARGAAGHSITIQGVVFDGHGTPVPDAVIETWQADARGSYPTSAQPGQFRGFGRVATGDAGQFQLRTILPGRVSGPGGTPQAPHLVVAIFMRGLLKHLVTRIYFADEAVNAADPILKLVDEARRRTLIAVPWSGSPDTYIWNVHLQGPDETVFFDI
jgi:protocatechuate 3,4-dioxygenase, alpha subunit